LQVQVPARERESSIYAAVKREESRERAKANINYSLYFIRAASFKLLKQSLQPRGQAKVKQALAFAQGGE